MHDREAGAIEPGLRAILSRTGRPGDAGRRAQTRCQIAKDEKTDAPELIIIAFASVDVQQAGGRVRRCVVLPVEAAPAAIVAKK